MTPFFDEVHTRYGDPEAFVVEIQARMVRYGITQGQLAERSGFPAPRLTEWLGKNRRNHWRPSMESMVILDEALEWLIQGG